MRENIKFSYLNFFISPKIETSKKGFLLKILNVLKSQVYS